MSKEKDLHQLTKEELEVKKLRQEIDKNDLNIKILKLKIKTFQITLAFSGVAAVAATIRAIVIIFNL